VDGRGFAALLGREDRRAERARGVEPVGARGEVGRDEPGRAGGLRDLQAEEADRAAAEDADRVARAHVAEVDGVDRDAERLEHGAVLGAEALGQGDDAVGGPGHPLAQRAVVRAVAGEADRRAEVGVALEAGQAAPAVDGRVDRGEAAVRRAARELVAGHERPRDPRAADAALLEPVQVGAAQPDGRDAHQRLALRRRGHGLVVQTHVACAVEPCRAHYFFSCP
jgi:hypothetical protein